MHYKTGFLHKLTAAGKQNFGACRLRGAWGFPLTSSHALANACLGIARDAMTATYGGALSERCLARRAKRSGTVAESCPDDARETRPAIARRI